MRHTKLDDYTPEQTQKEMMELLIKAARRCAYDLSHAADDITDKEMRNMFRARAEMWKTIFNPSCGLKDYRAQLHHEIDMLELRVGGLLRLCRESNVDPGDFDDPVL